jgi:hypothetical protein
MLHENHANRKRKKKMLNGNINAKALTSRNIIRGITEIWIGLSLSRVVKYRYRSVEKQFLSI